MMFLLFILTLVNSQTCTHSSNVAQKKIVTQKPSWDYHNLVLTWQGNFCAGSNCCDLPSSTMSIRPGFTIHGWWPEYNSGYPEYCPYPSGLTFDAVTKMIKDDEEFKQDIAYYWPSERKCKFFEYEYEKHGTCLADVYDGETGPKDYAMAAINFVKKHDFWKLLKINGIIADGNTKNNIELMRQIVCEELGLDRCATFQCSDEYLTEIWICTTATKDTKELPTPIECPSEATDTCSGFAKLQPPVDLTEGGCEY